MNQLFDVVCFSTENWAVLWVVKDKTLPNAEAVISMAIARQGVEDRYFTIEPCGKYHAKVE